MTDAGSKARLGRNDWVLAGLRALVRGGIQAVKVEALARDIAASKGSFYWHFKDLPELHQVMLELWEELATRAISAAVRTSDAQGFGKLLLLVDLISVRPPDIYGGAAAEPALRDWGRTDPRARAVVERVDRQRLADLQEFLRDAGVPDADVAPKALLIYAAVIGFESLRLTTGAEMGPALRRLVTGLVG